MGKKGRKTRWRKLPISIGNGRTNCGGVNNEDEVEQDEHIKPVQKVNNVVKSTFNEDEYTKITTPRQDMLFKKGYLGKKKTVTATTPVQDSIETQSADSMESDQYMCGEEQMQPQYMYPSPGYMDHTGLYYINNSVEVYDPYTGNVTVIVGPGYHTGPHTSVLTAVPCQPVPLQSLEWFNPTMPQPHPAYSVPMYSSKKKRNSIDSQNYSGQSSETTGPPGSPQEPMDGSEAPIYPQQYIYPGYMFGAPMYNMNGVTVQGVVPQSAPLPPSADQAKRRKKRRRRRRGGVTDEGSESSCEDMLSCDASVVAETNSGASSDTAPGSSSSKTNSDSGIHTDPTTLTSGANSPRLPIDEPYFDQNETNENEEAVSCYYQQEVEQCSYETEVIKSSKQPEIISSSNQTEETTISNNNQLEIISSSNQTDEIQSSNQPEEITYPQQQQPETITSSNEPEVTSSNQSEEITFIEKEDVETPDGSQRHILNNEASEPILSTDSLEPVEEQITTVVESIVEEVNSISVPSCINNTDFIPEEIEITCKSDECSETKEENLEEEEDEEAVEENTEISEEINEVKEEEIVEIQENGKANENDLAEMSVIEESLEEEINEVNKINENHIEAITDRLAEQSIQEEIRERPITEAVTKWLRSQGSSAVRIPQNSSLESEDEGIEEGEDALNNITSSTGQKNGQGNPFLASSPSTDNGTRVAIFDCTHNKIGELVEEKQQYYYYEEEEQDWNTKFEKMCDAKRSVHKYYSLGAALSGENSSTPPSVLLKTAMHLGHPGPFPCGICCIIQ